MNTETAANAAAPANTESAAATQTAADGGAVNNGRDLFLKVTGGVGAVIAYGCLAAFLWLICAQIYRWFREGEWPHVGMSDALHTVLSHCCVKDADSGQLAALMHWLDTPVDWLGLHKVFEVVPASLALFVLSILGNSLFIYCRDRLDGRAPTQ